LLPGSDKRGLKVLDKIFSEMDGAAQTARPLGFTLFFSGLSGAGKSTVAIALQSRLLEQRADVNLLDGNMFRTPLSHDGDCSKAFREQNTLRVAAVAEEITRSGGIAICATIAPNEEYRLRARNAIGKWGRFILVYFATPLSVCEQRDCNGLYSQARAGLINLTGVTDTYETPECPDLEIDTSNTPIETAVHTIIRYLRAEELVA
jgi:sulfate adenylyltransferase